MADKTLRLAIDELKLEEEWKYQSEQFYNWSTEVSKLQRDVDRAKVDDKVTRAETFTDVQKNPKEYGLADKPTVDSIKATVELHPDVLKSTKAVIESEYQLSSAKDCVASLEMRKRSLTMLTELWIKNYYSDANRHRSDCDKEEARTRGLRREREAKREREEESDCD